MGYNDGAFGGQTNSLDWVGSRMSTNCRQASSLRGWIGAVVMRAAGSVAFAAPQTPPPAAPPAAAPVSPEKKVRFEFRDKRWQEVLEWLTEQTGLNVISVNKPTGTFTFIAPKLPDG